ncbi:MAG: hypothetical protein QM725_07420 [Lacibacter sp.]|jgi:hypothetical protein|nr:hypothetical protein [Ferruginibacter sp.]HMP20331.1 hypothetical protein [Ferruginibacter sp.]
MPTYKEVIVELKSKPISARYGDFYDFEGFPLEEEFQKFFTFGQGFLDRDDLGYDIKPARLYFNTDTRINGLAYKSKTDYFLIELFKGAFYQLYDYYTSREDVFHQPQFKKYKDLMDKKDLSCSYILFQFVMLYIFYHEVGHLIQRTGDDPDYLEFITGPVLGNSSKERHMREHDADWFAASQMAFHVIESVKTGTPESPVIDPDELATATELALAGIYTYYIRQAEGSPELYFSEKSHPHPAVRICYLIIYLLDTLPANVSAQINQKVILTNAIRLAEALLIEPGKNIVEEFSVGIMKRIDEIETYISKIRHESESYPHLALKKIKNVSS